MRVDIWSDVVCPWCYLGKSRFASALAEFEHRDQVNVVYRSFELDPDWPADVTVSVTTMLGRKYGMSPEQAAAAEGRVAGLAHEQGLGFEVERPYGNTFAIHRVLHAARAQQGTSAVSDAVDQAYFAQGRDIFDAKVLAKVAADAGFEAGEVIESSQHAESVRADERDAHEIGITSVPFCLLDGALAVSGAQPVRTFAEALRQAWAREN
jgi:predicted DsbA family dithiol-disulfide isomerase